MISNTIRYYIEDLMRRFLLTAAIAASRSYPEVSFIMLSGTILQAGLEG